MSIYRDTRERMLHDAEFRALVENLARAAEQLGYTPGELKQIAFAAACLVEERNPKLQFCSRCGGPDEPGHPCGRER